MRSLIALISLPMVSSEIGASSISVSTAYQLTVAVPSTMFSDTQQSTAWISSRPRSSRSVSRLVALISLSAISSVSVKGGRIVLAFP